MAEGKLQEHVQTLLNTKKVCGVLLLTENDKGREGNIFVHENVKLLHTDLRSTKELKVAMRRLQLW